MEAYRFFGVNSSGEVVSDRSVQCADDAEARGVAAAIIEEDRGIEVWDVSRCVLKIAHKPPA